MRFVSGFFAAVVVMILVALAVPFAGIVNVAATSPEDPVTAWFLSTTMDRSVRQQARTIAAPPQLTDDQAREGFRFYGEACVYCHGAPGKDPVDIGKGLRPEPPYLPDVVARWSAPELFWIVKNGIRMTGMPAFAQTHKDEEIWNVVAFVQRLPKMTEADYAKMEQH